MKKLFAAALITILTSQVLLAAKVPDIQPGSSFYIENKSQSDEAVRFATLLASRLAKDEGNKRYRKPGLPVVERREEASYVLRIMFVLRADAKTSVFDTNKATHALVNAWLLDANGKELWSDEQDCVGDLMGEPVENCVRQLSDSIKSAQVDSNGKRAGLLGWRNKK